MLTTSDVKSLSKGGTTVSLEEISNNIDNKLSIDNLTGGNGIEIAKNTAGDKVEAKLSNNITLGFLQIPTQGITGSLTIKTFGGSKPTFIHLDDNGISTRFGNTNSINIVEDGIKYIDSSGVTQVTYNYLREDNFSTLMSSGFNLGTTEQGFIKLSNSLDSSYNIYMEVSHPSTETIHIGYNDITWSRLTESAKYLRENNVKTINNTSIYGSGNIDTTPTLKTINSQSITGDGNINTLKVYHGNEWNPEVASDFSGDMWLGYRTLTSGQDPTGTGTTSVAINAFKFGNGNGSGGFSDVYCKKLYTSSDERLKENIKPYEPTASVLDLSVKEFNYKDSKVKSVGVIAQEVKELFPDAVSADEKTGYLSVDDRSLMYMLMAEVKKLRDRVNELEGR